MKNWFVAILAISITGCTASEPQSIIHREGSTLAERQAVFDQCDFAAIQAIPRAMTVAVSPGYSNPGTLQCNTYGNSTSCYRVGAVNIAPTYSNIDANQSIRTRYINRCIEAKGYAVALLPLCTKQEDKSFIIATQDNQPPLSQITCAYFGH
ncbi:hypothetical protein PZ897_05660 [Hoeflea sp. YIM 152468]|uniref:hypothetical protein n=1 Tax=Hoeflea sp. YIM 152468 TaxID=3031759 RepID=UPI0023DC28FE|nr:hypothetical protein [Hoeflea sp. YIM 152468]MDF1607658.1 hypothetical protein [Hoeflea sp. YIM 152468]